MSSILEWDRRARRLEFDQLEGVRATAEKWRNGLGALTGIVSTATVLKGAEAFDDLSDTGRLLAAVLYVAAIGALVAASMLAMRAAFNQPDDILNSAEALRDWTAAEAKEAAGFLRGAQIAAPIAVGLLAAATAVTWVAKADEPKPPASMVTVELDDGTRVCGKPLSSAGGVIVVQLDDKGEQKVNVPLARVRTLTVGACPAPE